MNNKHTAKGILVIIVLMLGVLIGRTTAPEPEHPTLTKSEVWCFYAEYTDMDSMRAVKSPSEAFIDIRPDGKVSVFERCSLIYEQEN